MRVDCPRCGRTIAGADIDLQSQLAVCRPCGEVVSLAAALAVRSSVELAQASHAKYAAARLTQILADTQRDDSPYRG